MLVDPIRRRTACIQGIARVQSMSSQYSFQEWCDWLVLHPLDDQQMRAAVHKWRDEFHALPEKKEGCMKRINQNIKH